MLQEKQSKANKYSENLAKSLHEHKRPKTPENKRGNGGSSKLT